MKKTVNGFTIVELLIVVVVVAVLAAITIVAFNGIQQRARNSQRVQDVKTIAKALEAYYIDNGRYPESACSPNCPATKKINGSWLTTSDGSWSLLEAALVPKYVSSIPKDPLASTSTGAAISGGYNYDFVSRAQWCGSSLYNDYLLTYNLEGVSSADQPQDGYGCGVGTAPTNYSSAEYYVYKK